MEHANRILLLMVSAVAYAFAFPPFDWWPLALLSVGVLAGFLHAARPMHGLIAGFWWGMLAFGTGLSWIYEIFDPFSILLWGLLAVFPALFGWLVCMARQHGIKSGWRLALFTALAWTGTEFVRCELMPLKFPWMNNVAKSELAKVQAFALQRNALLVFGTQTRLEGPKWQNTALTIDGSSVLGEHGKNHPVHLFNDGEHGKTALPIVTPLGKIGTPICFDCDFQDVVRKMTLAGAEFFAVPSMDAAGWPARQHIQHSQLFRVRAAENRRSMVVAASSGVSQIIDSKGAAIQSLAPLKSGTISGSIERRNDLTFYTRTGWLTPWLALALLLIWTVRLLAFSKPKMPQPADVSLN